MTGILKPRLKQNVSVRLRREKWDSNVLRMRFRYIRASWSLLPQQQHSIQQSSGHWHNFVALVFLFFFGVRISSMSTCSQFTLPPPHKLIPLSAARRRWQISRSSWTAAMPRSHTAKMKCFIPLWALKANSNNPLHARWLPRPFPSIRLKIYKKTPTLWELRQTPRAVLPSRTTRIVCC